MKKKTFERKGISHPHPAVEKELQLVYRVYTQRVCEAKENTSYRIIE